MPAHGARKNNALQVAAFSDEVFHAIPMRDAGDILVDNWPLIERLGHIVTGRTDELYPPGKAAW